MYYDDANPKFLDLLETAALLTKAREKKAEKERQRNEHTVILGFSTHTRNLFSEMRKYAANFEGTAYLAENDKEYEHRENYSMGGGMYLERNKYSGWTISKRTDLRP